MQITIEISMYPFQENYRDLIGGFIEKLNTYSDIDIITCATSTMMLGEYKHAMNVLTEMMQWSHEAHGKAVFVTKFIPGYTPPESDLT